MDNQKNDFFVIFTYFLGTKGQKIEKSYLFIPETGDEFYRVARHLTKLEQHK